MFILGSEGPPDGGGSSRGNVSGPCSRLPVKSVSAGKTATRTWDVRYARVCVSRAKNNKQGVKTFGRVFTIMFVNGFIHFAGRCENPSCRRGIFVLLLLVFRFFFLFTSRRRRRRRRRHSEIEILRKAVGVCTGAKNVLGNKLNSRPKSVSNAPLIRVRSRYRPKTKRCLTGVFSRDDCCFPAAFCSIAPPASGPLTPLPPYGTAS